MTPSERVGGHSSMVNYRKLELEREHMGRDSAEFVRKRRRVDASAGVVRAARGMMDRHGVKK